MEVFLNELKIALQGYNCDVTYEDNMFTIIHTYSHDGTLRSWKNLIVKKMECESIGRILTSYLSPKYFIIISKDSHTI